MTKELPWFLLPGPNGFEAFEKSKFAQAWEIMRRIKERQADCRRVLRGRILYCDSIVPEKTPQMDGTDDPVAMVLATFPETPPRPTTPIPPWIELTKEAQADFKQDQAKPLGSIGFRPVLRAGPGCVTFDCTLPTDEILSAFREELTDPAPSATGKLNEVAFMWSAEPARLPESRLDTTTDRKDQWIWKGSNGSTGLKEGMVDLNFLTPDDSIGDRIAHLREFLERPPAAFAKHRAEARRKFGTPIRRGRTASQRYLAIALALIDREAAGQGPADFAGELLGVEPGRLHERIRGILPNPAQNSFNQAKARRNLSDQLRRHRTSASRIISKFRRMK